MSNYNGWSSYETWCVALWIDNDEGRQNRFDERAQEILNNPDHPHGFLERGTFTREQMASAQLDLEIKEAIEEDVPDLGASMWSDLLSAALSEVNWREIAEHYISDKEPADTLADDDAVEVSE